MKLLRGTLFIIVLILFLSRSILANAEEVPGTRHTDPLNRPGDTRWHCALDNAGQRIIMENKFTSGKPDRKTCPVYQGQQSICAEVANEELGKGVICEYSPAGSSNTPTPIIQGLGYTIQPQGSIVEMLPEDVYIDGNTLSAKIKFYGLEPGATYYLYPKTNQAEIAFSKGYSIQADNDGTIPLEVCGNGEDALKGNKLGKGCKKDRSDYFHEGNIYRLGLYDDEKGEAQIMVAEFYARHSVPRLKISPVDKGTFQAVDVRLSGRRPGGDSLNNYQLVLEGQNVQYKKEKCFAANTYPPSTLSTEKPKELLSGSDVITENNPDGWPFARGSDDQSGLAPGRYLLKVNEQIHDTGAFGTVSKCNGGYTYLHIPIDVTMETATPVPGEIEFDPNKVETEDLENLSTFAPIPCAELEPLPTGADPKTPRMCKNVRTAIGLIDVSAEGFVSSIFKFVLVIAGFGAIIIIIYSGYVLATSQGNKEKIAAARETLTSAILGLLFIIFSIVILEIIGIDILRIPGFGPPR